MLESRGENDILVRDRLACHKFGRMLCIIYVIMKAGRAASTASLFVSAVIHT